MEVINGALPEDGMYLRITDLSAHQIDGTSTTLATIRAA